MVNMCTLCRMNEEAVLHLFDGYFFFRESLSSILLSLGQYNQLPSISQLPQPIYQSIQSTNIPRMIRETILLTTFVVWRERCLRIFTGRYKTVQDMSSEIKQEAILTSE
jgi:hypothetical protein